MNNRKMMHNNGLNGIEMNHLPSWKDYVIDYSKEIHGYQGNS